MFVGIYSILLSPHQLLDSGCIVYEVESVSRGLIVTRQHRIPLSPSRLRRRGKGTYIYWETSVSSTLTDALSIALTLVFTISLIQISCYNNPQILVASHIVCIFHLPPDWCELGGSTLNCVQDSSSSIFCPCCTVAFQLPWHLSTGRQGKREGHGKSIPSITI